MLADDIGERPALTGLKVLIAEDDWTVAEMLKAYMQYAGAEVVACVATIRLGLAAFERQSVELLIADMNLIDGMADALIETADAYGAGIVVLTRYRALPSDTDHLVDEWIDKPVDQETLLKAVERVRRRLALGG